MRENILNKLKEEHRMIQDLLKSLVTTKESTRKREIFHEMKETLMLHMIAEENTIYKHLKKDVHEVTAEEVVAEAESEHQQIKESLESVGNMGFDGITFDEEFNRLRRLINDHILEEESDLFTEAKDDFNQDELEDFSSEYEEAKNRASL